jgi:hypothetical protein
MQSDRNGERAVSLPIEGALSGSIRGADFEPIHRALPIG